MALKFPKTPFSVKAFDVWLYKATIRSNVFRWFIYLFSICACFYYYLMLFFSNNWLKKLLHFTIHNFWINHCHQGGVICNWIFDNFCLFYWVLEGDMLENKFFFTCSNRLMTLWKTRPLKSNFVVLKLWNMLFTCILIYIHFYDFFPTF